jgi:hypothetical protein
MIYRVSFPSLTVTVSNCLDVNDLWERLEYEGYEIGDIVNISKIVNSYEQ